jgi:hypothetical protein
MGKQKSISTSADAYKSLEIEKISKMYLKIVGALKTLGTGTYEDVARQINEKPERVWKRMGEAGKLGLIHRPGEKKRMASGRFGFVWAPGGTPEPVKKKERVMKGKSVMEYSRQILNQPPKKEENLFS